MPKSNSGGNAPATQHDITGVLGHLDPEQLLAIMSLQPTVADVEAASLWLAGDTDVFGAREPIKGVASHIVTIITANEEEDIARAG